MVVVASLYDLRFSKQNFLGVATLFGQKRINRKLIGRKKICTLNHHHRTAYTSDFESRLRFLSLSTNKGFRVWTDNSVTKKLIGLNAWAMSSPIWPNLWYQVSKWHFFAKPSRKKKINQIIGNTRTFFHCSGKDLNINTTNYETNWWFNRIIWFFSLSIMFWKHWGFFVFVLRRLWTFLSLDMSLFLS